MMGTENTSPSTFAHDKRVAIRSAMLLGASLLATWTVGLLVRLYLPSFLGPSRFGMYSFAESFPLAIFGFLGLGVETYIQKEIPVRPEHASDFFGGVVAVRVALSALLLAGIAATLSISGRSGEVQIVVFIFGLAYFFGQHNGTLAALLQATRAVGGLALINVVSKILWGVGAFVAILTHAPLAAIAASFCVAEVLRAVVLHRLARRHIGLQTRVDLAAVRRVVIACLPYYVNAVAIGIYAKIDISIVNFVSSDEETGWYGAAQSLASIAMLLAPLMGSVLMPLLSRVASRSHEELMATLRRTIETISAMTIPVALMMCIGADVAVRYALGPRFLPATASVMILGPMFVLTYLAMILCTFLNLVDRPWTVTLISLSALVLDSVANLVVVPYTHHRFGMGGAGIGASLVLVATEALVVTVLLLVVGWRTSFDRRSLKVIGWSLAIALVVTAVDRAILGLGPLRLLIDGALYLALGALTGALDIRQILRAVLSARRSGA